MWREPWAPTIRSAYSRMQASAMAWSGLGAAILLPDTSPVLLSWALTDISCSTTAERKAVQWAGRQTQKLLKHDVDRTWTCSCINIFNDNQSVAFKQQNFSGRGGLTPLTPVLIRISRPSRRGVNVNKPTLTPLHTSLHLLGWSLWLTSCTTSAASFRIIRNVVKNYGQGSTQVRTTSSGITTPWPVRS